MQESEIHRIRKQEGSLLPTGGRRIDFYKHPEEWGLENQLIPIPLDDIDRRLAEYDRPDILQFGTDEMVGLCENLLAAIGSPELSAKVGWNVFSQMLELALKENH